jgi:hypothetical protein
MNECRFLVVLIWFGLMANKKNKKIQWTIRKPNFLVVFKEFVFLSCCRH